MSQLLSDSQPSVQPRPVAPWLLQTLTTALELAKMPANWDSYGSPPISDRALFTLVELLHRLTHRNLPPPHLSPIPGGGLQLEWEMSQRALELEVLPGGTVEYLTTERDQVREGPLGDEGKQLQDLIDWLTQGHDGAN
jgi:hypothetical protein